jgi:hypothetical protein
VPNRCGHDGFHDICSVYDRVRGLLLFYWSCEDCGKRLGEALRAEYRPQFERRVDDRDAATTR